MGDNNTAVAYAKIFNCQIAMFLLQYLRVSISARRLRVRDLYKLEEKLAKKLDIWQGGSLSYGGKTVLINSSLSNTPIYYMSMFLMPKPVTKRIDKMRRRFFFGRGEFEEKIPLGQMV
jgi:hypothetical protein